ncbi:MAG: hypothetical protein R3206_04815, partial [Salegentibacter mishustinae]|nr:hypothetical protein [Salegentibacter mishustinae]
MKISIKDIKNPSLYIFFILLTFIPIFRLINFLLTTGANNPSTDDVAFIPVIDQILSGNYNWLKFPIDVFGNGHFVALPILFQTGISFLLDGNIYFMLMMGVGISAINLVLIHDSLTKLKKSKLSILLWPLIAFLLFLPSNISTFEFPLASFQFNLNQFGLVLGIWGLVRFRGEWKGVFVMVLGGVIASLSWGGGPLTWPVFLMGLVFLNYRRVGYYLFWLLAFLISSFPYIYFQLFAEPLGKNHPFLSIFNLPLIVKGVGWPLVSFFPVEKAHIIGILGLGVLLINLGFILFKRNKQKTMQSSAALMLIVYSLLNIWQISLFRESYAPWYSHSFILFWIGLIGLG